MTDKIDILIAEDSRLQAKMLKKKLEQAGYAVRWAENGNIALEMTHAQRPLIFICVPVRGPAVSLNCSDISLRSCLAFFFLLGSNRPIYASFFL